jgi:hypothetical protein
MLMTPAKSSAASMGVSRDRAGFKHNSTTIWSNAAGTFAAESFCKFGMAGGTLSRCTWVQWGAFLWLGGVAASGWQRFLIEASTA